MAYYPFRGVLGLWPWPLVNMILASIYAEGAYRTVGAQTSQTPAQAPVQRSPSLGFHNVEKFKIVYNEAGDPVEIIVHRKVEPNE
jgi:hypothetical protein